GGDGVGVGADEAEVVGHAGLGGEVVHLVIEDHAGAGDDDLRPEGGVDGGGERDDVPVGVGGGDVRGVFPPEDVVVGVRGCAVVEGAGVGRRDLGRERLGIVLV